jgi:alkylation response protein AidB-like acyl-CoA dehydrogenase
MLCGTTGHRQEAAMHFEFSDDQKALGEAARQYLEAKCSPDAVRGLMDSPSPNDHTLWRGLAKLGYAGIAVPEEYGGLGLGDLELCVVAEQLGRVLAPVPFSSVVLVTEILLDAGTLAQKSTWLPKLVQGQAIGTLAMAERQGPLAPQAIRLSAAGFRLNGVKIAVPDGMAADFAIVAARTGEARTSIGLFLVDLQSKGVTRTEAATIDPSRGYANLTFDNAPAEPLGPAESGWAMIETILDRAAVLIAFEQTGGADRALEMARDYALARHAFGRPIGAFQAIKHMLADMYVAATLARSNAYYGAWALASGAPELPQAAATARLSATSAFQLCAKNNIQTHGGMGFTWAFDCHLYYRRSALLALSLGAAPYWENRLISHMRARKTAAAGVAV